MRPCPEQQHRHHQPANPERPEELALLLPVHLADDGVVADVLFDCVLEVDAHASATPFSTTRRRALRARGLCATSASSGRIGLRVIVRNVSPASTMRRNVCFTTRSSSEWNAITAIRPPA